MPLTELQSSPHKLHPYIPQRCQSRYLSQRLSHSTAPEAACEALADCHRESFRELMALDLCGLTGQLEDYMRASDTTTTDFVRAWKDLGPYRVAIPVGTDS